MICRSGQKGKNMNLAVNIAGVTLKNPVTVASGTFGSGMEYGEFVDLNRLGAVTTKGVANVPWPGYIPIFISMMFKEKGLGVFKGKIAPVLAICGSVFMVVAAVFAHGVYPYQAAKANGTFSLPVLFYLISYAVIMIAGAFFMKKKSKK